MTKATSIVFYRLTFITPPVGMLLCEVTSQLSLSNLHKSVGYEVKAKVKQRKHRDTAG